MFNFIRQSPTKLRLWFIAAAAVLLLMSVLEAGHVHGAFIEADDHCALCPHTVALDKILNNTSLIFISLVITVLIVKLVESFLPRYAPHFALIRAPPALLNIR